jgi:hypothetical protein
MEMRAIRSGGFPDAALRDEPLENGPLAGVLLHLWNMYSNSFARKKSTISTITEEMTTAEVVARPTPCVPPFTRNP